MSSVLFAQGKKDEALAELNRAIEIDPNRSESYLSVARFYMVTNDLGKAEEAIQEGHLGRSRRRRWAIWNMESF